MTPKHSNIGFACQPTHWLWGEMTTTLPTVSESRQAFRTIARKHKCTIDTHAQGTPFGIVSGIIEKDALIAELGAVGCVCDSKGNVRWLFRSGTH